MSPSQSMDRYNSNQFREKTLSGQCSFGFDWKWSGVSISSTLSKHHAEQNQSTNGGEPFSQLFPLDCSNLLWDYTQPGWVQVWPDAVDGWFRPRRCFGCGRSQKSGEEDLSWAVATLHHPQPLAAQFLPLHSTNTKKHRQAHYPQSNVILASSQLKGKTGFMGFFL